MIAFAEDVSGITVSFEFFPPKGEADEVLLAHHPQARDGEPELRLRHLWRGRHDA